MVLNLIPGLKKGNFLCYQVFLTEINLVAIIAYVFYFKIWTPSFQDSNGNGIGDFIGLINRLENLRRLGIQVIWINPFLHSDDFNDAVQDHLTVDPKLGTNDDAYRLIDAIHNKG